jgi:SulP family sulfate permease
LAGHCFLGAIDTAGVGARVIVLALGMVPAIDATGLVALESALERLRRAKKLVVIAGPFPEPRSVFEKANLEVAHEHVFLADSLEQGVRLAQDLILLAPEATRTPSVSPRPA